ncbi:pre-mRNA-splicing regulator WTAP-like isoform X2 [Corticium candelabrum]|uniref:pre-mRNA-splicing regulator WTAP-like isoform X2 n=1 Tax=Corticium candelabrum TaxID=121492 RepID=UPI002E26BBE4|nr:pre-mRNA-splicing regulator WTAP-like isoform X2 [Corticium candelabrum]
MDHVLKVQQDESVSDVVQNPPKRTRLGNEQLQQMSKEDVIASWQQQELYIDWLEEQKTKRSSDEELVGLRESEAKLQLQQQESTRRENVLVMRLATKEHEMQDLMSQIHELKHNQMSVTAQLQSMLLDPSVNILFQKLQTDLGQLKGKLEQAQDDLSAWKFTPDSVTGKKLMAKCRSLIQENQELGMQMSQGRIGQLESELSLQKKYTDELKTTQTELTEFVLHTDEEVEAMQATILTLQEQLHVAHLQLQNQGTDSPFTATVKFLPPVKAEDVRIGGTGNGVQSIVVDERNCDDGGVDNESLVVSKSQTVVNENGDTESRTSSLMLEG